MKRAEALKLVVALERRGAQIAKSIAASGPARATLSPAALERLTEAFPNPTKAEAFLASMPQKPNADEILKAFGSAVELTKLVDTTLGGNMRALAVLAERGCNRDPAKLKTFATTFDGDADFAVVYKQGGFAERPEAMAALLQGGCGGNPAKLKSLCIKFKDPADAKKLSGVLGSGGLGQSPEALGALAAEGNGDALKDMAGKFTTPQDHQQLTELLTKGGLGGKAPGRPALLSDIIKNGLGGDSAKLKHLHTGFAGAGDEGFRQMTDLFTGLDGADGKGGQRLKSAIDGFKAHGHNSDALASAALRTPFMTSIDKKGRAAAAPDIAGPSANRGAIAASTIPAPPTEILAGRLGTALAPGGNIQPDARAMALMLGPEAAALTESASEIAAMAAGLGKTPASGAADPAHTDETTKQIEALKKATETLLKPPAGPPVKDIVALQVLTETLLLRLTDEPDGPAHAAALVAAKAAGQSIEMALRRIAADALAKSGPAGAALAELSAVETLRAGASEAEKAALKALGAGTAAAAAVSVAAGTAVPFDTAKAAKAEIDNLDVLERPKETDKRNKAAEAATALAIAVAAEIKAAPVPVDPALVARVAALAADCVDVARACPDEAKAQAAFKAAFKAAEAAAAAAARAAAASKQAAAMGSAEAKKALVAGASCDRVQAMLTTAGLGPAAAEVAQIAEAVRAGALSLDSAERALTVLEATATDAAKDAISRLGGDPVVLTNKANQDAANAGNLAAAEALKLDTPPVTKDLILAAQTAAQNAQVLAHMAVDPVIRKKALEQARDAFKKVAAASAAFATAQMAVAKTQLVTVQGNASLATSNQRDLICTDLLAGGTGAGASGAAAAALDAGREAIANTAGALLSTLVLTDPGVGTARDAAVEAAALAAIPGASRLSRITALEKARDADKALALKALTSAEGVVNGLPAVPGNGLVGNLTNGVRDAFRNATAHFDAANGMAAKWRESAVAVTEAIRIALAELAKIPLKTQAETDDLNAINPLVNPAANEVDAARTQQRKFKAGGGGSPVFALNTKIRAWIRWINTNNHGANAIAADLFTSGAVALAQSNEGSRNGAANFAAMPRETLIRNAATLQQNTFSPGTGTNVVEDCAMDVADDTVIRKKHIAGRHVRESYEYGNLKDGGPTPNDYAAARLIAARYPTDPLPPMAAGDRLEMLRDLGAGREKVNSLMPEEVNVGNLTEVVEKALRAARDTLPVGSQNVAGMIIEINNSPDQFWRLNVQVDIPPLKTITMGIKEEGGKPKADMVYGDSTNTMTMPDMISMGRAIGL